MAECSGPPQSARTDALGTFYPNLELVDSSTPRSAPLSRCTLLRHSSFVRAVCVDAPVRICAGGDQRWSSLPRQLLYPVGRARSALRCWFWEMVVVASGVPPRPAGTSVANVLQLFR